MTKTRICAQCNKPEMVPVSRVMKTYNSVYSYRCRNCDETLEMVPPASIGVGLMVGALALAFWGFVLHWGAGSPSTLALVIWAGAGLAVAAIWVPEILKYWLYPEGPEQPDSEEIALADDTAFSQRVVSPLERLGFVAGLFAPVVIIAGILGIATLIGYVNYTFFE